MSMNELTKKEMLKYFEELNNRLARREKYGEIIIAGGAALTLVFNARESTLDIDALFHPSEDMRQIIESMANDYELPPDWLNDGVKGYITDKMKFEEFLKYSHLTISNVDAESLLAMKLIAARVNTKDMDDSIFLMNALGVKAEKDLFDIIEMYTHPSQRTIGSKYFTKTAFVKYQEASKLLTMANS